MVLKLHKNKVFLFSTAFIFLFVLIVLWIVFFDRFYAVVENKVYRSAQLSSKKLQRIIDSKQIKSIINLRGPELDDNWYQKEKEIAAQYNVDIFDIDFSADELPDCIHLNRLVDVLYSARQPILLHCKHGVDRSGMASAIALAIKEDAPLSEIKRHISWRYGIFPFFPSAGPLLFDVYEKWLEQNHQQHSREQLIDWIKKEYMDARGNINFWIDLVNGKGMKGKRFSDNYWFQMDQIPDHISINGWAFDHCNQTTLKDLEISIGPDHYRPVQYPYHLRPDVADTYRMIGDLKRNPSVGWICHFKPNDFKEGCETIFLKFTVKNNERFILPTRFKLCIGN